MGSIHRVISLIVVVVLVVAACGDDEATTEATEAPATTAAATTTAAPTTTASPTTSAAPTTATTEAPTSPELPPTGVVGLVDIAYMWGDEVGTPTEDQLPFPLGVIEAHWYQAGDAYAVVFVGLDLEETGPLCPGNSILTSNVFSHVSSSPTPGGSCEGSAAEIVGPPQGVLVCDGLVSYLTLIPNGTTGTLYASIEYYPGTGTHFGASAISEADPDYMAAIDPALLSCG